MYETWPSRIIGFLFKIKDAMKKSLSPKILNKQHELAEVKVVQYLCNQILMALLPDAGELQLIFLCMTFLQRSLKFHILVINVSHRLLFTN